MSQPSPISHVQISSLSQYLTQRDSLASSLPGSLAPSLPLSAHKALTPKHKAPLPPCPPPPSLSLSANKALTPKNKALAPKHETPTPEICALALHPVSEWGKRQIDGL
jgi:hypothetical protein